MDEYIRLMNYNEEVVDQDPQVVFVPKKDDAIDMLQYGSEMYLFETFNRAILGHLVKIGQDYVEQLPDADPVAGTAKLFEDLTVLRGWADNFQIFVEANRDALEPGPGAH